VIDVSGLTSSEGTSSQNSVLLHKLHHRDFAAHVWCVGCSCSSLVASRDCWTFGPTVTSADGAVPLVSSLATVSSGSFPFAMCLANAASVFVYNQELPKDIGN
jgi:hypothetical protein